MMDHQIASSILDRLNLKLRDFALEFGDEAVGNNDISHELWYESIHSSHNTMGYVWIENGLYYVSGGVGNHTAAESAALELLDPKLVAAYSVAIEAEKELAKEYF